MSYSRYCKYCPNNHKIFWDNETKKFYDDPSFTIIHKKHVIQNESIDELKNIKKIQKSILTKLQYLAEDVQNIKKILGINENA